MRTEFNPIDSEHNLSSNSTNSPEFEPITNNSPVNIFRPDSSTNRSSSRGSCASPSRMEITEILKNKELQTDSNVERLLESLENEVRELEAEQAKLQSLRRRKNVLTPKLEPLSSLHNSNNNIRQEDSRRPSSTRPRYVTPDTDANRVESPTVNFQSPFDVNYLNNGGAFRKIPTKIIGPTAQQTLFSTTTATSTTTTTATPIMSPRVLIGRGDPWKFYTKSLLFIIIIVLLLLVFLFIFKTFRSRLSIPLSSSPDYVSSTNIDENSNLQSPEAEWIPLKKATFVKNHLLTNGILQKSLRNICNPAREEPETFLFSGSNINILYDTVDNIHSALSHDKICATTKWDILYLKDFPEKWPKKVLVQLRKNPNTIFVFDVHILFPDDYKRFMSVAMDGKRALVIQNEDNDGDIVDVAHQIKPSKAVFVLLSDFGSKNFLYVRKSDLKTEERDYNREINRYLESFWPESLRTKIMYLVPFVHDLGSDV